ncbi:hypothetical protein VTJ83DRAFT_2360 [Remersonia thermophila]|uniref:RBR-type E3 ubiquitin transferase n=1 Tax=Remersonia thermophila TaxID=72144 RepID=A0ABR4DIR6_9PEZI
MPALLKRLTNTFHASRRQEKDQDRERGASRVRDREPHRARDHDGDQERYRHRDKDRDREHDGDRGRDHDRDRDHKRREPHHESRHAEDRRRDQEQDRKKAEPRPRARLVKRPRGDQDRNLKRHEPEHGPRNEEGPRRDHGQEHRGREAPSIPRPAEDPKPRPPVTTTTTTTTMTATTTIPHHNSLRRSRPTASATLTLKALDPRRLNFILEAPTGRLTIAEIERRFWDEHARRTSHASRTAVLTLYDSYCRQLPRSSSAILRIDHPITTWYQLSVGDQPLRWKFTHRSDRRDRSLEGPFWDHLRQAIDVGETVSDLKKRIARGMGLADANRVNLTVMDGIRRGTLHGNHWTLYHLRATWLCRWLAIDTAPSHGYVILRGFAGAEYVWYSPPSSSPEQAALPPPPTAGFLCEYLAARVLRRVHRWDRTAIAPGPVGVRLWRLRRGGGREEVCGGDAVRWGAAYDFELVDQEVVRVFLQEEAWLQREDRTCRLCFETRRRADMVLWRVARGCAHGRAHGGGGSGHKDDSYDDDDGDDNDDEEDNACCRECMAQHLRITLDSAGWERLRCPMCNAAMGWEDVRACAPRDVFERFDGLLTRAALGGLEDFHYCLGPGCRSGQVQDGAACPRFVCVACRHRHCIRHGVPWHEGETCEEYDERNRERQRAEELSEEVAHVGTMPCPGCNRPVAKDEGCSHIRCICGSEWCYNCGGLWAKDERGVSRCNHRPDCPSRPGAAWPVRTPTPEGETDDELGIPEEAPARPGRRTLWPVPLLPPPLPARRGGGGGGGRSRRNSLDRQRLQPLGVWPDRRPAPEGGSDTEPDAPGEAPTSTRGRAPWQTLGHRDDTDDACGTPDALPVSIRGGPPLRPPPGRGGSIRTNAYMPHAEELHATEEAPKNTHDKPSPLEGRGGVGKITTTTTTTTNHNNNNSNNNKPKNSTSMANATAQKSSDGNEPPAQRHVTWKPDVSLATTALGLRLSSSRRRAQLRAARQQQRSSEHEIA